MSRAINVRRISPTESQQFANKSIDAENIQFCYRNWPIVGKNVLKISQLHSESIDFVRFNTDRPDFDLINANFFLFLYTNTIECRAENDDALLAAAAPCLQIGNQRPLAAELLYCPQSPAWKKFKAAYDLFRHEIMHALGFGSIDPKGDEENSRKPPLRSIKWKNAYGYQILKLSYLKYSTSALEYAKSHFNCHQMIGIESEDNRQFHLDEYIFGNELMTPELTNGDNLFTEISARILEETYNGDSQWYRVNRDRISIETDRYWYGRGWGCNFTQNDCYDYINAKDARNVPIMTFPFCTRDNLIHQMHDNHHSRRGRPLLDICFATKMNKNVMRFHTNCLLLPAQQQHHRSQQKSSDDNKKLKTPILLSTFYNIKQHLFKDSTTQLNQLTFTIGSRHSYRYCPFMKLVLDSTLDQLPPDAYPISCPNK